MYSTQDDLNLSNQRLIELTDSDQAVGVTDDALIARMQARANARIDALLTGKYVTPVQSPFPPILTQIEADLWRFYLYEHRDTMDIPPNVQHAFDSSMKLLDAYRMGDEYLGAPELSGSSAGPAVNMSAFSVDTEARRFGRCKDRLGS